MGYIIFFIFIAGCISNPYYEDSKWDKRVRENPHLEDRIREEQYAYQREQTSKALYDPKRPLNPNAGYEIRPLQKGSFGFGDKDSALWIGYEKIDYLHEIVVTIVCNDHEVTPLRSRLSRKLVGWKLSEKHKGQGSTNGNGALQISVETEDSKAFENIKIIIKNRVFTVPLQGSRVLEVEPEICS